MFFRAMVQDQFRVIHVPFPFLAHWRFISPPAEGTAVGTADGRRHLHTLVAHDAIELQFVAATLATDHVPGPAAGLDRAMAADDAVALLH